MPYDIIAPAPIADFAATTVHSTLAVTGTMGDLYPAGLTVDAAISNAADLLGNPYVLGGLLLLAGFALAGKGAAFIKRLLRGR